MAKIIEIGTISSRGQIAIPSSIRTELELSDGERVIFILDGDIMIVKKLNAKKTWEELTKPIRDAVKKTNLKESDISNIIKRVRNSKNKLKL